MKKFFTVLGIICVFGVSVLFSACSGGSSTVGNGTVWHTGEGEPLAEMGTEGDFYLDYKNSFLYEKTADGWIMRSAFGAGSVEDSVVTVTFLLDEEDTAPDRVQLEQKVRKGSSCELPTPNREGYHFCGWFFGEGANGGQANDLTVFTQDTTLYARWKKKYPLTFTSDKSEAAVGEALIFSGQYGGTAAGSLQLAVERGGERRLASETNDWLSRYTLQLGDNGEFAIVVVFAEAGDYTLVMQATEDGLTVDVPFFVTVHE